MTVYFCRADYRAAQRDPHGADRAHAVCRRLLGVSSQDSPLYGACYWAACAMCSSAQDFQGYRERWRCEAESRRKVSPAMQESAWRWAVARVLTLEGQAKALSHSLLW